MTLEKALTGVSRLFLDSAPVIYAVEKHPSFIRTIEELYRIRRENKIRFYTSPITLAECIVHPVRNSDERMLQIYRNLIQRGENTQFVQIGSEAAEIAARLRANMAISLGDALQIGSALVSGCQAILTNDRRLAKIQEIQVVVLGDFSTE